MYVCMYVCMYDEFDYAYTPSWPIPWRGEGDCMSQWPGELCQGEIWLLLGTPIQWVEVGLMWTKGEVTLTETLSAEVRGIGPQDPL